MADEHTTTNNTKRAPKHGGNEEDHEPWRIKTEAWSYGEGIADVLFEAFDPHDYPERTRQITIDTDDDPRGPNGTILTRQTGDDYATTLTEFDEKNMKGWAAMVPQLESNALNVGMRAPKGNGRAVIRLLDEQFGKQSQSQVAQMLLDFVKEKKNKDTKVSDHINSWLTTQRRIDENGGFDKDTMESVLFLRSLGPEYRMFINLACMYPKDQFNLRNVMSKARDFQLATEPDDEADTSSIALMAAGGAANTQQQQGGHQSAPPHFSGRGCANCGNHYHKIEECFSTGGGLSHLNKEDRRRWLDTKRNQQTVRYGNGQQESHHSKRRREDEKTEQANVAMVKKLQKKIKRARKKVRQGGYSLDLGLESSESDSD